MSSVNTNDVLSALLAEFKTLNSRISTLETSVAAKTSAPAAAGAGAGKGKAAKKEKKAKDPSAPKRAPNAWILFVKRVRDLLKANGYTEQAVGVDAPMFCSDLKTQKEDFASWSDADILARRAAWSRPEVSKQEAAGKNKGKSGSAPASVVSGADAEEEADGDAAPAKKARKNPWAGLSEEQRAERIAKMKAGKAAKKAISEGLLDDDVPEDATAEEIAAAAAKMAALKPKKAEAAPAASKTEETKSNAAASSSGPGAGLAAASASASAAPKDEFKKVMLSGALYWVNMANGHAYHRLADQSQGEWAGLFVKTPKPHIDDSVTEPGAEEDELNFE
jgi:hypothetical protein